MRASEGSRDLWHLVVSTVVGSRTPRFGDPSLATVTLQPIQTRLKLDDPSVASLNLCQQLAPPLKPVLLHLQSPLFFSVEGCRQKLDLLFRALLKVVELYLETRMLAPKSRNESTQEGDLLRPVFLAYYQQLQLFFTDASYVHVELGGGGEVRVTPLGSALSGVAAELGRVEIAVGHIVDRWPSFGNGRLSGAQGPLMTAQRALPPTACGPRRYSKRRLFVL